MTWLLVCLGGALGALVRYGLDRLDRNTLARGVPIGILAANLIASFLLGVLHSHTDRAWFAFAAVGLCGGLSTYSTFALAVVETKSPRLALGYALGTAFGSIACAGVGVAIGSPG